MQMHLDIDLTIMIYAKDIYLFIITMDKQPTSILCATFIGVKLRISGHVINMDMSDRFRACNSDWNYHCIIKYSRRGPLLKSPKPGDDPCQNESAVTVEWHTADT